MLGASGLLVWREDRSFGPRSWEDRRWALAAGVFFAADLLLGHHSIHDSGAGLATVLANFKVVLVPLAAWAMPSERPALVAASGTDRGFEAESVPARQGRLRR